MKRKKIANRFIINYLIVLAMFVFAIALALFLLNAVSNFFLKDLMKDSYPASSIMNDDYTLIDASEIVANKGGVQIIGKDYQVLYTAGLDTIGKNSLTTAEFTQFLINSETTESRYHYDIAYNENGEFWLIVSFPTSLRFDLGITHNKNAHPDDTRKVVSAIAVVCFMFFAILILFTFIYSRIESMRIISPLQKLALGAKQLKEGDYSARVDLHLKNEFAELQEVFNDMAKKIEESNVNLKKQEEDRRKLILDISHDLKTPLASVVGYAEMLIEKSRIPKTEREKYLQIICENSRRANGLLTAMFQLSRLDSPDFKPDLIKTDVSEYLRQVSGSLLNEFESAGLFYEIEIPDKSIYALLDQNEFERVFRNLADNALKYTKTGTTISISLYEETDCIAILFADDGEGVPKEIAEDIFKPFVKGGTGGTGLGLSIATKIVRAHKGNIVIENSCRGAIFKITLPKMETAI